LTSNITVCITDVQKDDSYATENTLRPHHKGEFINAI